MPIEESPLPLPGLSPGGSRSSAQHSIHIAAIETSWDGIMVRANGAHSSLHHVLCMTFEGLSHAITFCSRVHRSSCCSDCFVTGRCSHGELWRPCANVVSWLHPYSILLHLSLRCSGSRCAMVGSCNPMCSVWSYHDVFCQKLLL